MRYFTDDKTRCQHTQEIKFKSEKKPFFFVQTARKIVSFVILKHTEQSFSTSCVLKYAHIFYFLLNFSIFVVTATI